MIRPAAALRHGHNPDWPAPDHDSLYEVPVDDPRSLPTAPLRRMLDAMDADETAPTHRLSYGPALAEGLTQSAPDTDWWLAKTVPLNTLAFGAEMTALIMARALRSEHVKLMTSEVSPFMIDVFVRRIGAHEEVPVIERYREADGAQAWAEVGDAA